jgi:hypothetical protein
MYPAQEVVFLQMTSLTGLTDHRMPVQDIHMENRPVGHSDLLAANAHTAYDRACFHCVIIVKRNGYIYTSSDFLLRFRPSQAVVARAACMAYSYNVSR